MKLFRIAACIFFAITDAENGDHSQASSRLPRTRWKDQTNSKNKILKAEKSYTEKNFGSMEKFAKKDYLGLKDLTSLKNAYGNKDDFKDMDSFEQASVEKSPRQGDGPKGDGPKGDGPKGDGPKGDGPKGDAPKGGGPKGDGPKADDPKGDGPKGDGPKGDGPKGDGPRPDGPRPDGPRPDDGPPPHLAGDHSDSENDTETTTIVPIPENHSNSDAMDHSDSKDFSGKGKSELNEAMKEIESIVDSASKNPSDLKKPTEEAQELISNIKFQQEFLNSDENASTSTSSGQTVFHSSLIFIFCTFLQH